MVGISQEGIMRNIGTAVAVAAAILATAGSAQAATSGSLDGPADFGMPRAGKTVTREFTWKNLTGQPARPILLVEANDGTSWSTQPNGCWFAPSGYASPRETCQITVSYTPHQGGSHPAKLAALIVTTDPGQGWVDRLDLTARALPPLVSSDAVAFGAQNNETIGAARSIVVTPASAGSPRLKVSGAGAGDFLVANDDCADVPIDGQCTVRVRFAPAATGPSAATLRVTAPNGDFQDVALSGTGVEPKAPRDGAPGAAGTNGVDGKTGVDGLDGKPGEKGQQGDAGAKGDSGVQGEMGSKGDSGAAGANGSDGPAGPQSAAAPTAIAAAKPVVKPAAKRRARTARRLRSARRTHRSTRRVRRAA
jgi:hypothetical protein